MQTCDSTAADTDVEFTWESMQAEFAMDDFLRANPALIDPQPLPALSLGEAVVVGGKAWRMVVRDALYHARDGQQTICVQGSTQPLEPCIFLGWTWMGEGIHHDGSPSYANWTGYSESEPGYMVVKRMVRVAVVQPVAKGARFRKSYRCLPEHIAKFGGAA